MRGVALSLGINNITAIGEGPKEIMGNRGKSNKSGVRQQFYFLDLQGKMR